MGTHESIISDIWSVDPQVQGRCGLAGRAARGRRRGVDAGGEELQAGTDATRELIRAAGNRGGG
jgi:hypothetical protein